MSRGRIACAGALIALGVIVGAFGMMILFSCWSFSQMRAIGINGAEPSVQSILHSEEAMRDAARMVCAERRDLRRAPTELERVQLRSRIRNLEIHYRHSAVYHNNLMRGVREVPPRVHRAAPTLERMIWDMGLDCSR